MFFEVISPNHAPVLPGLERFSDSLPGNGSNINVSFEISKGL